MHVRIKLMNCNQNSSQKDLSVDIKDTKFVDTV